MQSTKIIGQLLVAVIVSIGFSSFSLIRADEPIALWDKGESHGNRSNGESNVSIVDPKIGIKVERVHTPAITRFSSDKVTGKRPAVIVCPGGGYHILAWDLEGTEIAKWLNGIGVDAFVLAYRVPKKSEAERFIGPAEDVQRAIQYVRENSESLQVDSGKIGVLGFSAGGHLAAVASTNFADPYLPKELNPKGTSLRPDFTVLIYPAYLVKESSLDLTPEIKIDANTPPAICIHTMDDPVTADSSIGYVRNLKANKVSAELHLFPVGGHGYGLRTSENAVSEWPSRVERWLKTIKVVD